MRMESADERSRSVARVRRWRKRLDLLEQRLPSALPKTGRLPLLFVRNGKGRAALELDFVDEVLPQMRLRPLPESSPWIAGILDLRGELITVIDLRGRMAQTRKPLRPEDRLVVVSVDGRRAALIVEGVDGVEEVDCGEILPAPTEEAAAPYVIALLRRKTDSVLILGVRQILATSRLGGEET